MTWLIAGLTVMSLTIGAITLVMLTIWTVAVTAQRLQARADVRRRLEAIRNRPRADVVHLHGPAHASRNGTAASRGQLVSRP